MLTAVKYLKIFVEFEEYIQVLDDGEKGRLFAAMLAYARDGQEPELPGNERFLWPVARQQLKNAAAQYQKVCAANSANARRRAGVPPVSRPAGVPPVSRPTRQAQGPSAEGPGNPDGFRCASRGDQAPHVPPCPPGELGGKGSFLPLGPKAPGVPPVSRPTRP